MPLALPAPSPPTIALMQLMRSELRTSTFILACCGRPSCMAKGYVLLVPNWGTPCRATLARPCKLGLASTLKSAIQRNNNFSRTKEVLRHPPTMTSNAAPTTTISEFYHITESRITQGIDILRQRGGKPNISTAAREFNVPEQRVRARWNG